MPNLGGSSRLSSTDSLVISGGEDDGLSLAAVNGAKGQLSRS